MKYTSLLLFTFIMISCQRNINLCITETTETATVVNHRGFGTGGNRFEGVIFSETMELDTVYEKRFTPTVEEIELVESLIKKQWKSIVYIDTSDYAEYKSLEKSRYRDYSRQYLGVLNEKGQKEIHVNLLYNTIPYVPMGSWPVYTATSQIINKELLKVGWIFFDTEAYIIQVLGRNTIMTNVIINIKKGEVITTSNGEISTSFTKEGKIKLFPYGNDFYEETVDVILDW